MSAKEIGKKITREFKLTTAALKNTNTILLLTLTIAIFGVTSYRNMPKELTPDVVIPTVLVQTIYPGSPPVDIENLITRPLEKEIETIKNIKVIESTSAQGHSMIWVEFNTDVEIEKALQDVKDGVDRAESELPDDLLQDPMVMDIDFSEFPILNINLSGDYSLKELKGYAEYLEDEIEQVDEISKVEIKGINERQVNIDVDLRKMESRELSFFDIENAIKYENISMSGGEIRFNKSKRSVRIIGEFETIDEIKNIVIKSENDELVYLKDIADVELGYKDPDSYARLNKDPVVSVQVIKKSGRNLLSATAKIKDILDAAKDKNELPQALNISITNDMSDLIENQLSNLENSIILGVIFVILILFFFLGTRNSLFVGTAIPMSMFLSFIIISMLQGKMNMIVLFSLILALGLLVDNSIVVVENIHRFMERGLKPFDAAKQGTGEIAMPIITSTITTLSAFIPLAFWGGITGEFMKNLPITLIIVLSSSLFVALVLVPVFTLVFTNSEKMRQTERKPDKKKNYRWIAIIGGLTAVFYLLGWYVPANILAVIVFIATINALFLSRSQEWFQHVFLQKLEKYYHKLLTYALVGKRPVYFFLGTVGLLIFTIVLLGIRKPNIEFFPNNNPDYINVRAELPVGTDIRGTDSVMKVIEKDIYRIIEPYDNIVESVLTTVGDGAGEEFTAGETPNMGLTTVTFVDYIDRKSYNTSDIMKLMSDSLIGNYPGAQISIEKNQMGPPTGNPVNIEIVGEDFIKLMDIAEEAKAMIEKQGIPGLEGLKMDLETGKPEIIVNIDREKARRYDLSTMQIANTIRTSLFGTEVSDFKVGEDDYPIWLNLKDEYRYDISGLMNQTITFKKEGRTTMVPVSAVADIDYSTTYGAVKRKDLNRVITLYSNVLEGYNANEINNQISQLLKRYEMPKGYSFELTGEQEEQSESQNFIIRALIIALALILIILVTQFNSLIKPLIILASVIFSTIGVFGGIATFKMDIVVVMTGVGIVSLAGIVVNNAIVLVDYIELLKRRKRRDLGLDEDAYLPVHEATQCVIQAGETRLRPVLLTAITTVLGLLPLAVGLNMDFGGLLARFEPELYFGGNMVMFWGPIAWSVIFGLTFSTFLTLVIVPVMYRITIIMQKKAILLVQKITGKTVVKKQTEDL
jgi:multidrug efflux pump subunit AcrB